MQAPKRHIPLVGILGLILIAAAGGGIYYYQFILPHVTNAYTPVHRLVFMTAVIEEVGGFHVNNTVILNQTSLPAFDVNKGANLTEVQYQNYQGAADNKTIEARVGDKITFYIRGVSATGCAPDCSTGHGFAISGPSLPTVVSGGPLPCPGTPPCIPFNQWYTVTVTFTAAGTYAYFCTTICSPLHGNMNGHILIS